MSNEWTDDWVVCNTIQKYLTLHSPSLSFVGDICGSTKQRAAKLHM